MKATDLYELAGRIKAKAVELGFDLAGIAPAEPARHRDYLRQWLDDGRAGTMDWLERRFDERVNSAVYLSGCQSVICVGVNYNIPGSAGASPSQNVYGRVARYARFDDYHDWLKTKLFALADWLRAEIPEAQTKVAVDTAPVLEKELAARAGIGWMGKHTCIINSDLGSWLLLGEVLTTLALPSDSPGIDRCGTCRRCIDACPTGAIVAPYQLDARRCISYLNIEHRGELDAERAAMLDDWLFGCDICQEVCPWNRKAPVGNLLPRENLAAGALSLDEVLAWSEEDYRRELRGTPLRRVKLPVLQRNVALIRQRPRLRMPPAG